MTRTAVSTPSFLKILDGGIHRRTEKTRRACPGPSF